MASSGWKLKSKGIAVFLSLLEVVLPLVEHL
jgi:hypothetical protein